MRIIGKSKDYYDSALAFGQDESIVYVRKPEVMNEDQAKKAIGFGNKDRYFSDAVLDHLLVGGLPDSERSIYRNRWRSYSGDLRFYIIGFCGKFYPCVQHKPIGQGGDLPEITFYAGDKVRLNRRGSDRIKEERTKEEKKIDRFLAFEFKEGDDLFHKFQTPIIVFDITDCYFRDIKENALAINVNLSEYKFFRVKDAFTAFQELSQYIGGVIGVHPDPVGDIADKDMRDAKGFDEWSFKRRPSKPK